jgi:hypothetical protein
LTFLSQSIFLGQSVFLSFKKLLLSIKSKPSASIVGLGKVRLPGRLHAKENTTGFLYLHNRHCYDFHPVQKVKKLIELYLVPLRKLLIYGPNTN